VKKAKRFLALFLVLCMMVCAMALPASAYSYNFSFPAQQANSMRSTSLYTRGTSTAYVDPDVTTISTIYFLSPTRVSSTQATALVYKTSGTRSNFSWLSGYGGKGNSYCLSGCPDWNVGSHTAYSSLSYPKEIALKLLRLAQSFKAFPLNTVSSFLGVPVRNSPRMGRNLVEGCD